MTRLDLSGIWSLTALEADHARVPDTIANQSIPAQIPGDNLSALHRAGLIADPYFGMNELELQWIGRTDWKLERSFDLESTFADSAAVRFRADSLDTIAEIAINGRSIGSSENMFTAVDMPVPPGVLQSGANTIVITFRSAELTAVERAARLPYPIPHTTNPVQSPHRNLVRKVQCHSGWDWGPCFMVCGINGTIELVGSDEPYLSYAPAMALLENGRWVVRVEPRMQLPVAGGRAYRGTLSVTVYDPGGTACAGTTAEVSLDPRLAGGEECAPVELHVRDPQLWWPNGFGDQPLYRVVVEGFGSRVERIVGFRTLEVRRDPDEQGESFTFVVNEVPVFAKGANWIPQDAMPGNASLEQLRWLLESARDANMNMLRVWGGGTYESDRFYELCDELGLMIWQDFMFSCALYPSDLEFLDGVRREVTHQVLRLKDHASLALWCGNNENVGSLGWFEESRRNRDRYIVDYDRLNEGVVGLTCRTLDPSRLFWPSSPTDGPDEYSDDWKADEKGDMHYWSVWHGGEPFSSYRTVVPRFCSEFGFQSFPSLSGVETYTHQSHHNVTAPQMEHHQRNARGNTIILQTMSRYYRFPDSFDEQLYLSQVQQAHAIRTAVEYWRARRPRCMGALYWQLNDTWPVASWASIEYGGKWKLLHYCARRFFAPVMIAAIPVDADRLALDREEEPAAGWDIFLVNDRRQSTSGDLTVRVIGFDGTVFHQQTQNDISISPGSSTKLHHLAARDLTTERTACFGLFEWSANGSESASDSVRTQVFFAPPKSCRTEQPQIVAEVTRDDRGLSITLATDLPAFDVALDLGNLPGRFTDNMLTLLPDVPVTVDWIATEDLPDTDDIGNRLAIRSLNGTGLPWRPHED